tara:strand:- start:165 stop:383 length:219 start_codon:yes stop_codon:yes gene_type:complete
MEWKSIETAPKDGTKIIGLHFQEVPGGVWSRVRICYWSQYGWQGGVQSETSPWIKYPTYWMPLPPLPTINKE